MRATSRNHSRASRSSKLSSITRPRSEHFTRFVSAARVVSAALDWNASHVSNAVVEASERTIDEEKAHREALATQRASLETYGCCT